MTASKQIIYWLYACCFMVFAMAVIGAITRLTESGLSIVEWKPVMGALPPLNEAEWERVFALYKEIPEFKYKHNWMTLDDFKQIYFWEWLHRLWGRLIGLVYALPLAYFWLRGMIPQGYKPRLLFLLFLGGLQGVIGYWMVASGLADRIDVSHYRLAVHLSLALVIFALLFWTALDLKGTKKRSVRPVVKLSGWVCLALLSITIIWGAFVAGLNAGQLYNTFPDMNGSFTPQEQFNISSIIDQSGWVQFFHRWIAVFTGICLIAFAVRVQSYFLGVMVFVQIGLGIAALLSQVMIPLAAAHQAGAIILLALLLHACHRIKASSK